jgi:hypothetical protein
MNEPLKQNSLINQSAADVLIKKQYYVSSVHCSYYSCFQLILFILESYHNITWDNINTEKQTSNNGSHEIAIKKIKNDLIYNFKIDSINFKDFNDNIHKLKKLRTDSDYKGINVDMAYSNTAFNISKSLTTFLNKTYSL